MKSYTKREMAHLLKVSPRTILNDVQFLNIEASFDDRGTKRYKENDFNLIKQLRQHLQDKSNSRESFVPNTEVEILDIEPKITKLDKHKLALTTYEETLNRGLETDPFFDLEMLERISDRGWLLPTARLAPLVKLSPQYLNTFKKYSYCGFTLIKEAYVGNKIMWKISK